MGNLITSGERALFTTLGKVQQIFRDAKIYGSEYYTAPCALSDVLGLYMLSALIKSRDSRSIEDLLEHFVRLPIIWDKSRVSAWESERPWKSGTFVHYYHSQEYAKVLDEKTPVNAYLYTEATKGVWTAWFNSTPRTEICDVLESSAKRWLDWERARPEKSLTERNAQYIANLFRVESWYHLIRLTQMNNKLQLLAARDLDDYVELCDRAWGSNISNSLAADSELRRKGLVVIDPKGRDFWAQTKLLELPPLEQKVINEESLLSLHAKRLEEGALPLAAWEYIDATPRLIKACTKPLKVLVYGDAGVGKSTFIATVLHCAGLTGYTGTGDASRSIVECIDKTAFISEYSDKYVPGRGLEFVTAKTLEDVLNRHFFDFTVEITPMPLDRRLGLSKHYFKDANTALKLAQCTQTPQEIVRAVRWCAASGDNSWENAVLALPNAGAGELLRLVQIEESLPPMAGYPQLDILKANIVKMFQYPDDYIKLGANIPKGVLLCGPAGVGKTHFARTLSQETHIPLFTTDTAYLAQNPEKVKQVFKEISAFAPAILFIDEIDCLINDPREMTGVSLEKQKVTNSFLAEVDGVNSLSGILIIGATHRYQGIDAAATRSGRLSEVVHISSPNTEARKDIWTAQLTGKKHSKLDLDKLAEASVGFSGADIAEAVNRALIACAQQKLDEASMTQFIAACDDLFWGMPDGTKMLSTEQREIIAYHEAGHALVAMHHGFDINRVTIMPRAHFLGAVHWSNEGNYVRSLPGIKKVIEVAFAGIASEQVKYGYYNNGGVSDIERAKDLVQQIFNSGLHTEFMPTQIAVWSNEQKLTMEEEEKRILKDAFDNGVIWCRENRELIEELAELLLERHSISGPELMIWRQKVNFKSEASGDSVFHSN